jgi:hypothetical protein
MALTQMQLIQSLGEAMAWFERELNWGVPEQELRHLSGRIGELYAAVISNGQMAMQVNQRGYDVVSATGERISVKTVTSSKHVTLNENTLNQVDRVIILRINTEEMQVETIIDAPVSEALKYASKTSESSKYTISVNCLQNTGKPTRDVVKVQSISIKEYIITELENGSIEIYRGNQSISPVKPILRELAKEANLNIFNSNGNPLNTRQLGSLLIKNFSMSC